MVARAGRSARSPRGRRVVLVPPEPVAGCVQASTMGRCPDVVPSAIWKKPGRKAGLSRSVSATACSGAACSGRSGVVVDVPAGGLGVEPLPGVGLGGAGARRRARSGWPGPGRRGRGSSRACRPHDQGRVQGGADLVDRAENKAHELSVSISGVAEVLSSSVVVMAGTLGTLGPPRSHQVTHLVCAPRWAATRWGPGCGPCAPDDTVCSSRHPPEEQTVPTAITRTLAAVTGAVILSRRPGPVPAATSPVGTSPARSSWSPTAASAEAPRCPRTARSSTSSPPSSTSTARGRLASHRRTR